VKKVSSRSLQAFFLFGRKIKALLASLDRPFNAPINPHYMPLQKLLELAAKVFQVIDLG
jgi:hypothetical protein